MDATKLNDWMQVVGIFALVASLIFVGLQMQQDREIALAATCQERSTAVAELMASQASSPTVVNVMTKTRFDDLSETVQMEGWASPLTQSETYVAMMSMGAVMTLIDNSHYQYQQGFLPPEHWERIRRNTKRQMKEFPVMRSYGR
jgi:hypothetical protein